MAARLLAAKHKKNADEELDTISSQDQLPGHKETRKKVQYAASKVRARGFQSRLVQKAQKQESETMLVREMMEINRVVKERMEELGVRDLNDAEEEDEQMHLLEETNLQILDQESSYQGKESPIKGLIIREEKKREIMETL